MKKRVFSIMGLSVLLAAFALGVVPAQAQNVEQKIQALEQELSALKSDQMELKKEAAAAAAAMPTFRYDPGQGVRIEAADKAWALQLSHEIDWLMPFQSGRGHANRTYGEVMTRRFRQEWNLCINNCFYEVQSRLDMDGFGTQTDLQRAQGNIHFGNINPWLPTVYFGADIEATGGLARAGSSATGAQAEYDLLSRNNGFNTGRTGTGVGIAYRRIPLDAVGIPGHARFNFVFGSIGAGDDGRQVPTNKKSIATYLDFSPFSQTKNKWIRGFTFEMMGFFCNTDKHTEDASATALALAQSSAGGNPITANRSEITFTRSTVAGVSACQSLNIRDNGPGGRQSLFNTGLITGGMAHYLAPGIRWQVGPYTLRGYMGFQNYSDEDSRDSMRVRYRSQETTAGVFTQTVSATNLGDVGKKQGRVFLIGHDLFLWSPKGFLTGDANTPGSILFGTHFERTDALCDTKRGSRSIASTTTLTDAAIAGPGGIIDTTDSAVCNRITPTATTSRTEFVRNRILVREWDLWYFIAPRASVGVNVLWYDASNLPTGFSSSGGLTNDVQKNLGASGSCRNKDGGNTGSGPGFAESYSFSSARTGCGGEWVDVFLRLRWSF